MFDGDGSSGPSTRWDRFIMKEFPIFMFVVIPLLMVALILTALGGCIYALVT